MKQHLNKNISHTHDELKFKYRVVGIAIHDERTLLSRLETEDFWAFPGGKAKFFEESAETLRREMKEELGTQVKIDRLLFAVENFFEDGKKHCHEIAFYYLIEFLDATIARHTQPFYGIEEVEVGVPSKLVFQWFPIDGLETMTVYPSFLKTALKQLPSHTQHLVVNEIKKSNF